MTISSFGMSSNDGTVKCPYYFSESYKGKTVPEHALGKAEIHLQHGRGTWIRDTISGEEHTYDKFEEETMKIASAFNKKGLRKGDVVIFMVCDIVKTPIFFTGVWRANGCVRVLYPEEDEGTILAAVQECRVGWIFCEPEQAPMCLSIADKIYWDVEIIATSGEIDGCTSIQEFLEDDGAELPEELTSSTDAALMLCTSGTTGRSKAAVHTHQTVVSLIIGTEIIPWTLHKPNLILSKATHVTGAILPLALLCKGACALVMSRITKECMLQAVDEYKPGFVWGFPNLLLQLANGSTRETYDRSSLEILGTGGAPCTPGMQAAIKERLPNVLNIITVWGMTEALPIVANIDFRFMQGYSETYVLYDLPEFSIGKVFPQVELQCRDPDTGEILGPNVKGELCIKSSSLMIEYFQNSEATQNTFIDGFLKTGDLGYYDENKFIFLVDRVKEIFKYKGNHISPTEIEDIIARHPAVSEVCVVGLPDSEDGFLPRAFITKRGQFDHVSTDDIKKFANENLAEYKHLRGGLYVVPEIPKGKTGKITRSLVEKMTGH